MSPRRIPLSEPELGGNEGRYLQECLDSGWVSSAGPIVERFERAVADYTGSPHAVAVASGTAALHTALRVVGVAPGDEVLVSDLTFVAPVNAILYCQAHPVLLDADPATWQMDAARVATFLDKGCERRSGACVNRRTGRRVRAILPVHILGSACDIETLMELARRHGVKVVEDAAEGMGARERGRHIGTIGDAGALSFNGNKVMTAGGGGMVLARDEATARYARYLTTQAKDDALESIHHEVGYNYRLSSLQAALGLAQLERLDGFLASKRRIADAYERALAGLPGLESMGVRPDVACTYWLYTVLLPAGSGLEKRRRVIEWLRQDGIEARPLWHPIHGLRPFASCERLGGEHAQELYTRSVSLPSSAGLSPDDQQRCIESLRRALVVSEEAIRVS